MLICILSLFVMSEIGTESPFTKTVVRWRYISKKQISHKHLDDNLVILVSWSNHLKSPRLTEHNSSIACEPASIAVPSPMRPVLCWRTACPRACCVCTLWHLLRWWGRDHAQPGCTDKWMNQPTQPRFTKQICSFSASKHIYLEVQTVFAHLEINITNLGVICQPCLALFNLKRPMSI